MSKSTLVFLVSLIAAVGCNPNQPPAQQAEPVAQPPTLVSHDLPSERADAAFELIRDVLKFGPRDERGQVVEPLARAVRGPGNTALVVGPPAIQAGVKEVLARLDAKDLPADAVSRSIEVTYWLVHGVASEETAVPNALAGTQPALDAIVKEHGPLEFDLVERSVVRSVAGGEGENTGRYVKVKQSLDVHDSGAVVGYLNFGHIAGELTTKIAIPEGTLLVVGESGAKANAFEHLEPVSESLNANLFYIIRARVL